MKKSLLLLLTVMMAAALLVGCQKKTYSLSDYIEYEVEGVDGEGTITAKFNYEAFISDARIPEKYQEDIEDFRIRISQEDGLYNGDKVKLTVRYDRDIEEKINAELTDKSVTITVKGLDEPVEETKAEETSAAEESAIEEAKEESSEASSEEKVESAAEESSEESAASQEESSAQEAAESAVESTPVEEASSESAPEESSAVEEAAAEESAPEEVPEESSEPSPLDGYVKVATELTETVIETMKADADKRIRDREAFDMDAGESLESVYFMESMLLVSNDGTDEPKNAVYVIYRLTAKNPNGDFSWYDCFRYSDLTLDSAGNVSVDLETASGLWQRHIAEDNKRAGYYYYTGYETLEEIREFCQTELGENYSVK